MQIQPMSQEKLRMNRKKTVMSTTSYAKYLQPQIHTCIAIGLFHCLRTSVSDLIPNNT